MTEQPVDIGYRATARLDFIQQRLSRRLRSCSAQQCKKGALAVTLSELERWPTESRAGTARAPPGCVQFNDYSARIHRRFRVLTLTWCL